MAEIAFQEGLKLCEVSILPLEDGTLVAFLRENSGHGWDCYKSISYDQGESWNGLFRMPLPGCHRPVSGLLKSGRVLITFRMGPI
ncbi:sialidase family protein [Paenibacillus germinis]|uniref:sialidase family protein n=1 Tax=Paenibacillus germinis TaxID=2654979 RepID=UPI001FE8F749|nr:sialidase family protein [Paenibacillus germinis]